MATREGALMIGRLHGVLLEKRPPDLLIDVQGVGYEVAAPMSTFYNLPEVGAPVTLLTHMVVREDAQLLYGFASEGERRLFRSLIRISGVGAKLALAILSGMRPDEFASCVQCEDATSLTRLPGIGRKTAERLLVEMRDRLEDWSLGGAVVMSAAPQAAVAQDPASEAMHALMALGYKPAEASKMVRAVEAEAEATAEQLIREALRASVRP
jgi:Holliday junction DNA helicase RuvA